MGSQVDDALDRRLIPLTKAAADAADAELQAEFMRLNPGLQRRVALKVLEVDALRREVEQLREERDAARSRVRDAEVERENAEAAEAEVERLTAEKKMHRTIVAGYADRVSELEAELQRTREGLRGVSNAYGCFAGCTGGLPGAPDDAHTPACREARALLAGSEAEPDEGGEA